MVLFMTSLVLGAMNFGTLTDESTSFALLDRFVDAGNTVIDTANCYAFWNDPGNRGGKSELMLGRWLAARPGLRDRLTLATKAGAEPVGPGEWPANREGLSAPALKEALTLSLGRLGIDHVDLFWTHMEDRSVPLEETAGALAGLVADGLTTRVGVSNHPTWRVERARALGAPYSALQLRYSYLTPRPWTSVEGVNHRFAWVTDETLDYVASEGLDLWAYTPLISGSYVRPERPFPEAYDHPDTTRRLAALARVADGLGATRNQVVLAWLLANGVSPIIGPSTVAQLDELLDLPELGAAELAALDV